MRIRWTAIPSVSGENLPAPLAAPGSADRTKRENRNDESDGKVDINQDKQKAGRARKAWVRLIRKEE